MNSPIKIFSLFILLFSMACNQQNSKPEVVTETPANTTEESESALDIDLSKLANTTDLVCGMSLKGGVGDTATYNGKLYGFCSHECKEDFTKNPSSYLQ